MENIAQHELSRTELSWTSGITHANGIDVAWEQAGPSHGEPLILIMGLARQLISWPDLLCESLVARGFRLTRFDNRDIGLSGAGDRGLRFNLIKDLLRKKVWLPVEANYTLHDMTEDTLQLMNALDIRAAHVVGVSMGGMIAQLLASKSQKRVLSLTSIMSSTNHPWLPPPAWEIMRVMGERLPRDCPRDVAVARAMMVGRLIGSPLYPKPEAVLRAESERAFDRAFRPDGGSRQTHAIAVTGSIEPLVKRIVAPTQVIHGTADRLVRPAGGQRSAKLIRHSNLAMIEGMGHDLPDALAPRLVELITSNAARA